MEEYGIMEYLELAVTRCGRWTGNREFIWSGLTSLEWPTLQNRTIARLTFLFNLLAIPDHCLPSPTPVSYTRAQHHLKLTQLQTRVDVYKYSFLPRTIIQWNSLQIPNINTIDLETFKNTVSNIIPSLLVYFYLN